MKLSLCLVLACAAFAQGPYDLLLKGGHVIDGKNHLSAVRDVAIQGGKIAAVAADIPASKAHKVVNVSGLYVTPGLIDIHVHVYAGTGQRGAYSGDNSVYPDGFTFRAGVTTVVDAGGSGWRSFPDFKDRVIDRSKTRVLAMLNIVGTGMGGGKIEQNVADMDAKATANQALQHKDIVVGVKTAHYAGPDWVAVERAVEAGTAAHIPVMVDFGQFQPTRPYQELVLTKLRPGDISTHMYLGTVPMLDDGGKVQSYLFQARKRGVIFDVGHGGGSFLFRQAWPAVHQGFTPDSISTDLHINSMNAGMKDMLNVMSKFLAMGMSLDDVIVRSTWNPAREIHREQLGNLDVGAPADVAVLSVAEGNFGFTDVYGARLRGNRKLVAEVTLRNGRVVWDLNGLTRDDWDKLPAKYMSQYDPAWEGTLTEGFERRGKK
ncbi:MAG TPA: amidohydrolase/deacetylase family metallohydrolase [Bryobacteraceae bacterium]|jgi:dihydroorotase|nr:amidohydrolase/deacetylase family metallohydrolase [Bryobacteraceae bacterium]